MTSRPRHPTPPAPFPTALLALLALAAGAAGARAQGIEVTVDRTEATVEDALRLEVLVTGTRNAEPQLPSLPDFRVGLMGRAAQVQVTNGRRTDSILFTYSLQPTRPGTFTIGAAKVEVDGRSYESEPFIVHILPADRSPGQERDLYIDARVSDPRPYVGEQILYIWRLYRRVEITDARLDQLEFPGFLVENLGDVREYATTSGGQRYLVSEFRKALFPQEAGTLTIQGPRLLFREVGRRSGRGLIDDLFGRTMGRERALQTEPVAVTVEPLPPSPPGFSGLVGNLRLQARLSRRELKVGESTTYTLTVSGRGNPQAVPDPGLPELPGFKVYDDRPESSIERGDDGVRGHKTFTRALVPLQAGVQEIPGATLTYFDPEAGSYRTASTGPIQLTVSPGDGEEDLGLTESLAPGTGKVAVKILADDILPIHRGLQALTSRPLTLGPAGGAGGTFWLALLVLPPLAFAGVYLDVRRRQRYAADAGLRRRREALRQALITLRQAEHASEPAAARRLASRALRQLIGDKLGVEGSALTAAETDDLLRRHGLPEELAERTRALLEGLEAAQYASTAAAADGLSTGEVKALARKLDRRLGG